MKKLVALGLAVIMALGTAACGGTGKGSEIVDSNVVSIRDAKINMGKLMDNCAAYGSNQSDESAKEALIDQAKALAGEDIETTYNIRGRLMIDLTREARPEAEEYARLYVDYHPGYGFQFFNVLMDDVKTSGEEWKAVLPNGFKTSTTLDKLENDPLWHRVMNNVSYGDIYRTEGDMVTGFGKAYNAIYLDGMLVDVSAFAKVFEQQMAGEVTPNIDAGLYNQEIYDAARMNRCLPIATTWTYVIYENHSHVTDETKELVREAVIDSYAFMDCLNKIATGEAKELMVVRVMNNSAPKTGERPNDTYSCVLIRKDNSEK